MSSRKIAGAAMIEFLIVTPLLLLLGLGAVQAGLLFHAKSALNFALQEAARLGAVNHGSMDSVRNGLQRGLVPFMGGGSDAEGILRTRAKVIEEFALGTAQGWIRVNQLSPMPESFTDWEEDATDDSGNAIKEIPNANLAVLRCTRTPNSGVAGVRTSTACGASGERIGESSQQTLADANLLKLQLTYGVRLVVPFVNRIVGRALAMANGCIAPERQQVGPLDFDTPAVGTPNAIACAAYNARDASGNPQPRIPISLSLTVRMQSTPRSVNGNGWFRVAGRSRDAHTDGVQLGNGEVDPASSFASIPVAQLNPNGVSAADDDFDGTDNGSVYFGADTDWGANYSSGGGTGPGSGDGNESHPATQEPECKVTHPPRTNSAPPTGVLGAVFDALKRLAGESFEFVRGIWDGLKDQLAGIVDLITNPVETARGIWQLVKALVSDFTGTAKQIGQAIGKEFTQLVHCGMYEKGFFIGNNIDPTFLLKLAGKLARFAEVVGDLEGTRLERALEDTKREMPCASFAAGTFVTTPEGVVRIENLKVGDWVQSRNERTFDTRPRRVVQTFHRQAPSHRALITEFDTFELTDEHPLWVQSKGWVQAKDITNDDVIATTEGDVIVVNNDHIASPLEVFNLSVEQTPSYFVGKSKVWAHNAPCQIRHERSTGTNAALNNPEPNTRYYVDERHAYQTDELGRTTEVTSTITREDLDEGIRNCYQQGKAAACGIQGDEGGHLIGAKLGGPGERINLVPQNMRLNRRHWRQMENEWAKAAAEGKKVEVEIKVIYPEGSQRPSSFVVESTIDGVPQQTRRFENEAP